MIYETNRFLLVCFIFSAEPLNEEEEISIEEQKQKARDGDAAAQTEVELEHFAKKLSDSNAEVVLL